MSLFQTSFPKGWRRTGTTNAILAYLCDGSDPSISECLHLRIYSTAIFHTAYEGSQWHLTISTEAFIKGAPYFPPGASLAPAGAAGLRYKWVQSKKIYEAPNDKIYYDFYSIQPGGYPFNGYGDDPGIVGYGESVAWDHYLNASSTTYRNISSTAEEAGTWDFLNATSCQTDYLSCKSRTDYGDVVVIIDLKGSAGWTRSELIPCGFQLSAKLHAIQSIGKQFVPTRATGPWICCRYKSLGY
ncbi:hypothetical protein F5B18DRAFT_672890 [Nemania serpens]|nr:hypothetical protein F5B18DRAFT_672890 [Nemania serpens]